MVSLVYTLKTLKYFDPQLFDYILLVPSMYYLRAEVNVPCFLETDYRKGLTPRSLAVKQAKHYREGDFLVGPDLLSNPKATLKNIKEWRKIHEIIGTKGVRFLGALQFKTLKEAYTLLDEYEGLVDAVGVGYYTCLNAGLTQEEIISLAREVKERGFHLHLFGFSITMWRERLQLYRLADTIDSISIARKSFRRFLDEVRKAKNMVEKQQLFFLQANNIGVST